MTHPLHLHATAALHSLAAAWPHLERAQRAAKAAARDNADRGTLQAWRPGSGGSSGSGPARSAVLDAVVRPAPARWLLGESVEQAVQWLGDSVLVGGSGIHPRDTLLLLRVRVPKLHPLTAGDLARWVGEADTRVRDELALGDDHQLLPGVACPACGSRRLAWRMSAPPEQRVVVCEAGCTCEGDGCRCGMSVLADGVGHIWTRAELGATTKES